MVNITVLKPFYDLKAHKDRRVGDTFEVSHKRAAHLELVLPGYTSAEEPEQVDLTKLTMQQLTAIAKERGVKPKGRTTKAQLIEILSKE